ncbi:MAG: L,D-transpeptidase [Novosphingobium sp. 12-64-8]|nr:MAG: L,D-transpeptidase [Novosphingobium sp. 12-64-8]
MSATTDFFRSRWLRVPAGFVAMSLASLLAFHVGQDAAQVLFGKSQAEAAPMVRAPAAKLAAAVSTPKPTVESPFVVKSILKIDEPIKFGQFYWDESKGEPGPLVVTVDLEARVLSVFRNGHEIGATAILKGYGEKPTPVGVFPISEKDADHVSNIYDAPMPYMLRLTGDGVSIHSSKVEKGYATNGCIGVPDGFAKRLFAQAKLGDKVIITDGKRIGVGDPILSDTHVG